MLRISSMSLYRCAFLFCRALALALAVEALIDFVMLAMWLIFGVLLKMGVGGVGVIQPIAYAGTAILLFAFSKGISATLVGQNTFEGEAIQSSDVITPQERAFVVVWAGMLIIIPAIIGSANFAFNTYFTWRAMRSAPRTFFVLPGLSVVLKAFLGFMMIIAFQGRRSAT